MILNRSEECTNWVTPGSENYVFCSDKENVKLCEVVKEGRGEAAEEVCSLWTRKCAAWECETAEEHSLTYHLYLLPENVQFKNAAALSHDDSV